MLKFNPLKFLVTFNPPYSELLVLIIYTGIHMYTLHTHTNYMHIHTHARTHTHTE